MEKTVLLIDDEASIRRTVATGLMQRGYHTEPCENGMKALQKLDTIMKKGLPLDYVISDIRLPDIDGLKLLKIIKFHYPNLPVIVITGYGSEAVAWEAKDLKADAYLEKPFSMDDLARILDELAPAGGQIAEATDKTPEKGAAPAAGYVLVKLDTLADTVHVYRQFLLSFQNNLLYCDPIRGEHDFVLLLQGKSNEEINAIVDKEIKDFPGVANVSLLTVETPIFADNLVAVMSSVDKALGRVREEDEAYGDQTARVRSSSYVMFQIEKERLEEIYPVLYFNDQVVYCDYTRGDYDIVALMKGTSFSDIENTIRNKFKPIEGILKVKEWPIITLFEQ
jgi:CheY-like chemotaxis protein